MPSRSLGWCTRTVGDVDDLDLGASPGPRGGSGAGVAGGRGDVGGGGRVDVRATGGRRGHTGESRQPCRLRPSGRARAPSARRWLTCRSDGFARVGVLRPGSSTSVTLERRVPLARRLPVEAPMSDDLTAADVSSALEPLLVAPGAARGGAPGPGPAHARAAAVVGDGPRLDLRHLRASSTASSPSSSGSRTARSPARAGSCSPASSGSRSASWSWSGRPRPRRSSST